MTTTHWSRDAVASITNRSIPTAPLLGLQDVRPLLPGIDLWDLWPVRTRAGAVAEIADGSMWLVLSAPVTPDPEARHAIARIRAMHRVGDGWRDLGPMLPDGMAPGSREWAGSAIYDPDARRLTLFFTAAGRRGEARVSFAQRLFETCCLIDDADGVPSFYAWSPPVECVASDGALYTRDLEGGGQVGTIKAFRDPDYFRDPADGQDYLLFTGSLAASGSDFNGAIGLARKVAVGWELQPPIIDADGVNNELERPHVIVKDGRYYCFWSTQAKVFAPDGPRGPNGLYGMVAERLTGPWRPLNGSGLVLANPAEAPYQCYSWLVRPDLRVVSFLDMVGLSHAPTSTAQARAHFGGTPAPELQIVLDGDRTRLA